MSKMMEYKGYHAQIEYDNEDEIFVGKVFGITDSLNFHGTSVSELEEMFHQSIDNYLEMCAAAGKTPDKEFKGSFNVRISPELHRGIALRAAEEGITLNQFVLNALLQSLSGINANAKYSHKKVDAILSSKGVARTRKKTGVTVYNRDPSKSNRKTKSVIMKEKG